MSYFDPVDHRSMALDDVRNAFYEKALAEILRPDSVVLDAGAGIGVLGLMAAKLGAAKVYLLEPATELEAAKQIASANGLNDQLVFVDASVENASIPEKVDVITSVFTGNFLLEEDLLPSLFLARDKFLKTRGTIIPGRGRMMIAPVSMPAFYRDEIDIWSGERLVDHGVMKSYAVNRLYYGDFADKTYSYLGEPQILKSLDFGVARTSSCSEAVTFEMSEKSILHGFLGWFDIDFGHAWLSTSPESEHTHWSQVFLPIETPIKIAAEDKVTVHVDRPQFGEWSWRVHTGDLTFQQSTFLGTPMTTDNLRLASQDAKAKPNKAGLIQAFVLQAMDGETSSTEIADSLMKRFPDRFPHRDAALRYVISQVRSFGC